MHFPVGVVIKPHPTLEATKQEATKLLQRFDLNHEVAPYKDFPNKVYVRQMLKVFKVKSLEELSKSGQDWKNGEEGGIDEKGLYFISRKNPLGYIDAWTIKQGPITITPDIFKHPDYNCSDIITPDGELHKGPLLHKMKWAHKRKISTWNRSIELIAEQYEGMALVIFDCHG